MLRTLGAFLLVFCLLSLVVQQDAVALLFGVASVALFAIDLLWTKQATEGRVSRPRVDRSFNKTL
jgi:hypothetical protein